MCQDFVFKALSFKFHRSVNIPVRIHLHMKCHLDHILGSEPRLSMKIMFPGLIQANYHSKCVPDVTLGTVMHPCSE